MRRGLAHTWALVSAADTRALQGLHNKAVDITAVSTDNFTQLSIFTELQAHMVPAPSKSAVKLIVPAPSKNRTSKIYHAQKRIFFCECSFCLAAWEDPRMSLAGPHGCGMPAPALGRWGWASARDSWGLRWGGDKHRTNPDGFGAPICSRTGGALYSDLTPKPNPGRYGP